MLFRKPFSIVVALIFLVLIVSACVPTKPAVVISSPPSGSTYHEGDDVAVQSTSADQAGVVRVELTVDGAVVRDDTPPTAQTNYSLVQTWKATQGAHTILVRAYNASGAASDPAAISISVNAAAGAPTSVPTSPATAVAQPPTAVPPTSVPPTSAPVACSNNAAFVTDVTVPDGTSLAPGQTFNKIWRVKNTGTCAWTTAYDFAFVTGEAMATTTAIAVPNTAPGATADLLVAMAAPTTPGVHTGQWKLRTVGDTFFGGAMAVSINVIDTSAQQPQQPAQPPATGCTGTPNIASFTASSTTINAGQSTTLNWGAVTGADSVEIDNGIGGVAAPGTTNVSPGSTTTYTMTAHCGSNTQTAQVTITVTSAPSAQADLYVTDFTLTPNPPAQGASVHVKISAYNGGNAATGSFKVKWLAGATFVTPPPCTWTVASLPAHGGQVLECDANPYNSPYGSLVTRAQVDYENSVAESNEGNNTKDMTIQVLAPSGQPDLYVTDFTLTPNPPHKGASVHVKISAYNGGNAAAGSFKVKWLAGATFVTPPPCTWTVASLPAHGGQVLQCDANPYNSPYGSLVTRAQVDYENSVAESNESNNTKDMTIQVLSP